MQIKSSKFGAALTLGALLFVTSPVTQALEENTPAPAFELQDSRGNAVQLKNFSGKVVYLDFWASWCGPCQKSFPWMNTLQEKFSDKEFQVVTINVDEARKDAERFLAAHPAKFSVLFDPKGQTPIQYGVKGMPTSLLIGRNGKVIYTHMGFSDSSKEILESKIRAALNEK